MPVVGWVAILIVLATAIRLAHVSIRYRAIRASGRDVRWEVPAARWWRSYKVSRGAATGGSESPAGPSGSERS